MIGIQKNKKFLLPFVFNFNGIVNLSLFYFGLTNTKCEFIRSKIFLVTGIIFFIVVIGGFLADVLKKKTFTLKTILLFMILPFFLFCCFGYGFISYGIDSFVMDYFQKFVVFVIPAYILGYYFGKASDNDIKDFFIVNEKINLVVLIPAIVYIVFRTLSV